MNRLLSFFAIFLLVSRPAMAAPSCPIVVVELRPCLAFIKSSGVPSKDCCEGVKKINDLGKTKPDRVAICNCIKNALSIVGPYDPSRIPLIPEKCGVPINLPPIDQKFDCSKVSLEGVMGVAN
ncbi:hypothetical protein F0562_019350 [Nyssa sinensis]|uniref:Non-specific lipid-transfer protein n=1 Tax=Nyssa sinensis TaxID=561372 RepID=A0A5J4ZFR6_9ASTE|nr:hypothetical protein F0562_019350 [Nyssa sinensis]